MGLSLALAAEAALAFPLNAPDPKEMGSFRCRYKAIDQENNAPLGDRALSEQPPAVPTFADGLRPQLVGTATDKALKKAGRGKGLEVRGAVASLISGGTPVRLACSGSAATADDFVTGCKHLQACRVVLELDGTVHQLTEGGQLGPLVAPIDSPAEALGLLAVLDRHLLLPLTSGELAAWTEEAAGFRAVAGAPVWAEVLGQPNGWVVRAPRRVDCGCQNDLVRLAWWVSTDGRACQLEEAPEPLAVATRSPACE